MREKTESNKQLINKNLAMYQVNLTDKNREYYKANVLDGRNVVAKIDTVWVADMFSPSATIEQPNCVQGSTDIKVLVVIDLASREIILSKAFQVKNHGNVKSSLVCKQFKKLFLEKKGTEAKLVLIVHTDRGSEFASKEFNALLLTEKVYSSMSRPNTPNDNPVAERYIRIIKSQLPAAGEWPQTFRNIAQAAFFLAKRIKYINEVHVPKGNNGLSATQYSAALKNNQEEAPDILLQRNIPMAFNDIVVTQIHDFKRDSASKYREQVNNQCPSLAELLISTNTHAKIASQSALAQPAVNQEVLEKLASIENAVIQLAQKQGNKNKQRRQHKPLRDCANADIYVFLMAQTRPKGTTRHVWARNRMTITLLRWTGCRASDIASLTLKQITQAIQNKAFQIIQPKTGTVRYILLPEQAVDALKAIQLDFAIAFEGDTEKPLASGFKSSQLLSTSQWLQSLNDFIKPAREAFNLVLSTHSFRVHYITSLLRTVPLQGVTKIIAHSSPNTTVRYDRYIVDSEYVRSTLGKNL